MTRRKTLLGFLLLTTVVTFVDASDPLKSLAQKLQHDIKAKKCPLLSVLNFPYSLGRQSTGSDLVSERLMTYLVQNGAPVVERRLLQCLLQEKYMWETGVIDTASIKSAGGVLGVEAIVIGTMADSPDQNSTEVVARVVRVDTGEILSAATIMMERVWQDFPKLPKIAQSRSPVPASYPVAGLSAVVSNPDKSAIRSSRWAEPAELFRDDSEAPEKIVRNKLTKTQLDIYARKKKDLHEEPLVRRLPYTPVAVPVLAPTYVVKKEGGHSAP